MRIDEATLRGLAELAKLELEGEELERMRRDLDQILEYVAQLGELDTRDVPPTTHVLELFAPLRRDEVRDVLPVEGALRNAPQRAGTALVVPQVKEQ
jgi:aspartyl-tRNA(Asn)/glutamyl-tRNA(Gln) amidotransferase subunit C